MQENQVWRVLSSQTTYQKKWLQVKEESCELPNGSVLNPYIIIGVPDFCNVVMVTTNNQIVMVQQYRHAAGIVSLELPGGMIDQNEDPLTAVKREMQEETGYVSDDVTLLFTVHPNPPLESNRAWFYLAKNVQLAHSTEFDDYEDLALVLLSKDEFMELLLNHRFTHGTQSGAMYAAAIQLGWLVTQ